MTTFTSEDRAAAMLEPIPFAGYVPVEERKDGMTEKNGVNPNFDALEQRVGELLAQYEQLAKDYARLRDDYAQLKLDANRYIQLWLDTKPKQPLTSARIREIELAIAINQTFEHVSPAEQFARAIEAAHGIGGSHE